MNHIESTRLVPQKSYCIILRKFFKRCFIPIVSPKESGSGKVLKLSI